MENTSSTTPAAFAVPVSALDFPATMAAPVAYNYTSRASVLVAIAMTDGIFRASRIRRILKFFENFDIKDVNNLWKIKETFNMLEVFYLVIHHQEVVKKLQKLAVEKELWRLLELIYGNSWALVHLAPLDGWRELVLLLVLLDCCPPGMNINICPLIQGASKESAMHTYGQFLQLRGAGYAQLVAFEDEDKTVPRTLGTHTFKCTRCGGDPKKKAIGCCSEVQLQMLHYKA